MLFWLPCSHKMDDSKANRFDEKQGELDLLRNFFASLATNIGPLPVSLFCSPSVGSFTMGSSKTHLKTELGGILCKNKTVRGGVPNIFRTPSGVRGE